MWFIIVLALIFSASVVAIFVRIEERKGNERLEKEDFFADDFEIIE